MIKASERRDPDPVQQWIFHQAEKQLTTLPGLRYGSGHRKGRLKILIVDGPGSRLPLRRAFHRILIRPGGLPPKNSNTSDEPKRIAEDTIAEVDASGLWPFVTEVVPAGDFWEAEPEHQDYLQRYPDGYTCHFVRPHWRLPIRTDKVAKQA